MDTARVKARASGAVNDHTLATRSPVQDRIMAAAADLFYRQGYRATGINQVIAESGVAKASFYDHFPSKDDLLYAYVLDTSRRELADVRSQVDAKASAGPISTRRSTSSSGRTTSRRRRTACARWPS
jgi:AcrR family transcriptional regulator